MRECRGQDILCLFVLSFDTGVLEELELVRCARRGHTYWSLFIVLRRSYAAETVCLLHITLSLCRMLLDRSRCVDVLACLDWIGLIGSFDLFE